MKTPRLDETGGFLKLFSWNWDWVLTGLINIPTSNFILLFWSIQPL
jgi:hypothetical protein